MFYSGYIFWIGYEPFSGFSYIFKKYRFVQSFKIVILFYYNSTCNPCDVAFITLHNCVLTKVMSSDCMFLLYLYFQACIQVLLVGR